MKKFVFIFLCILGNLVLVEAQNININEDYPISQMMESYIAKNKSTYNVEGWRIQIMATTDRLKMEAAKSDFLSKYPNVKVDWTHSKPYYRLRAGAFATKLEAVRLLYKLKRDYPSAYPAKDNSINPQELIES